MKAKTRKQRQPGKRKFTFSDVMQTRVPEHIRHEVHKILEEKLAENEYVSESDYLRDLVIKDLKARGRV